MHLIASSEKRPGFSPLVLAVMAAFTLPLTPVHAAPPAPPDFPDTAHVKNGCFISSTVYVAKFLAAFPRESATPVTVQPANYESSHTIALLTWEGHWWARDEYFGVFALNRAVTVGTTADDLAVAATRALVEHATWRVRTSDLTLDEVRRQIPVSQRAREIATAAKLLPLATEILWVRSGREEIPFLFFHPAEGKIAVYDPLTGTTQADCPCTDGQRVVATVAARNGYRVDSVHRDPAASPPVLVASSEPLHGGLAR